MTNPAFPLYKHPRLRIHIFGASGTGTTTLGRALASRWSISHHDTDDYYWQARKDPFKHKRLVDERLELMKAVFLGREKWILSGSVVSWSELLLPYFDLAIFLSLPITERMERIRGREVMRYGERALAPGGVRHHAHQEFMQWNASYEDQNFNGRSRQTHEDWIEHLTCPVLRLNSSVSITTLVEHAENKVSKILSQ